MNESSYQSSRCRIRAGRLHLFDSRGRLLPTWFRCWLAGLVFSYLVAVACWLLAEVGFRDRVFVLELREVSGTDIVFWAHQRGWLGGGGINWQRSPTTYVTGYGWPIASWGTVWVDARRRNFRAQHLTGIDVSSIWPPDATGDRFQRVIPIYPLWGQTAVVSTMWGVTFYVFLLVYRRMTRPHKNGCRKCGYPLEERMAVCPECGLERKVRRRIGLRGRRSVDSSSP